MRGIRRPRRLGRGRVQASRVRFSLSPEIRAYYSRDRERRRFDSAKGRLERERTRELILRFLPRRRSVIYDIGGGPGIYATWLARLGHEVHLVDPVAVHLSRAQTAAARRPRSAPASIRPGDARRLDFADSSADVVLLMGPLYHLLARRDRLRALREAYRVLRPGGLLYAIGISRFNSMLEGSWHDFLTDPRFLRIVERDLKSGRHRNPEGYPNFWTTAHFARPEEMVTEVRAAGFRSRGLYAVEGYLWWLPGLARKWRDPVYRERLLGVLRRTEEEPSLMGIGPHLLCVAAKPHAPR